MTGERDLDVLVIGAGQAGLATGYHLRSTGLEFAIVDGNRRVGDSWRNRFASLKLFTPRSCSALPGLAVPGDPEGFPDKDEVADYLESYAARFKLPVELGAGVSRLEHAGTGFSATLADGTAIQARAVVVATGAFQRPRRPDVSGQFGATVRQIDATAYTRPAAIGAGTVLVVGDGATGRQIALELARTHTVVLATGKPRRPTRSRILGRSIFWWLDRLGLLRASGESLVGRRLKQNDPFPGRNLDLSCLRAGGVGVVGRVSGAAARTAWFTEGPAMVVDTVIWATGYVDDTTWVAIPGAIDAGGSFAEQRGISPVAGLFFVGRNWQRSRGSALITGVGADSFHIVAHVASVLTEGPRTPRLGQAPATPLHQ